MNTKISQEAEERYNFKIWNLVNNKTITSAQPTLVSVIKSNNAVTESQLSNTNNFQRVWVSLVAGAVAGAAAKTAIAPLDRTHINFEISQKPYSAKAAIKFLVNTYKKDGLFSLWRGNSVTMIRIIPYAAIQFTAHEQWKKVLKVDGNEKNNGRRFIAGALAGTTSQAMTYPLGLARAQMAVIQKDEYETLRQVFARIYRNEGIAAFYRGFTPTILGVIPYTGCRFLCYDKFKSYLSVYTINSPGLSAVSGLLSGAVAGMIGQASSYPLDIIRRRMQTSSVTNQQSLGIISMARKIYSENGFRSFYKGLSLNWIKGPIAIGISFATYDSVKDLLRKVLC